MGGYAGVVNYETIDFLNSLVDGQWDSSSVQRQIPISTLVDLGSVGPVHRKIGMAPIDGKPNPKQGKGPFDLHLKRESEIPKHPVLWWSRTKPELGFELQPEITALPKPGMENEAEEIWQTASRVHLLNTFRLTSNPHGTVFTLRKSLGGSAWPTFISDREEWDYPILLWQNTTMGLMINWLLGSRTQAGRSMWTVSRLPELPTFDVRTLTEDQLKLAKLVFDEFSELKFLNASRCYQDDVRIALDRAVLEGLCGIGEPTITHMMEDLERLRLAWCSEPTVHGGNKHRPQVGNS